MSKLNLWLFDYLGHFLYIMCVYIVALLEFILISF